MTYLARLPKLALILVFTATTLLALALPRATSASHEPDHVITEASSIITTDVDLNEKKGLSKVFSNIGNGFKVVGRTVAGWFRSLGRFLGLGQGGRPEGSSCEEISDCARGLACLNACDDINGCEIFDKLCIPVSAEGASTISIKPLNAPCDIRDLCAIGTQCRRTCPEGIDCEVTHRCLATPVASGSCEVASDCRSSCDELSYPPIGPSGFRASCQNNTCFCQTEEVLPTLRITTCSGSAREDSLSCPEGLVSACTREGCSFGTCDVRRTCLTAPTYGGQCLTDIVCTDVNCAAGSAPFCDTSDNKCRCKSTEAVTVSCSTVSECQGISCPAGQNHACLEGVCTCEKKTIIEEDFVCTAASQCPSNCPESFSPACVEGTCACQRIRENVPIACVALSDCAGVSCPEDFEKLCLDGSCACTKTTLE